MKEYETLLQRFCRAIVKIQKYRTCSSLQCGKVHMYHHLYHQMFSLWMENNFIVYVLSINYIGLNLVIQTSVLKIKLKYLEILPHCL